MKKLLLLINMFILMFCLTSCPARPSQKTTESEDTQAIVGENFSDTSGVVSEIQEASVVSQEDNSALPQVSKQLDGQGGNRQEAPRHNSFDQDVIDSIKNNTKKE